MFIYIDAGMFINIYHGILYIYTDISIMPICSVCAMKFI